MADAERTEKPTSKRKSDARKKGQIARSRDLVQALASLTVLMALGMMGPGIVLKLTTRVSRGLSQVGDAATGSFTPDALQATAVSDLWFLASAVGPVMFFAGVMGLFANMVQGGWNFASGALQLRWANLSPATGLKRLVPRQNGIEMVKHFIAIAVVSTLAWQVGRGLVDDALRLPWMSPAAGAAVGWSHFVRLLWRSGLAMLALACGDYGLQLWRVRHSLKMTKQEVKEESRMSDGSPEIKRRVRQVQFEMFRRRMLSRVKTATVVVTNPTHYAVALEYRRHRTAAPVVVAKGQDHLALRIKQIAREHGVPTVENVPLARALYHNTEVGDMIPADLFGAVAEVLAYLVRIKQRIL